MRKIKEGMVQTGNMRRLNMSSNDKKKPETIKPAVNPKFNNIDIGYDYIYTTKSGKKLKVTAVKKDIDNDDLIVKIAGTNKKYAMPINNIEQLASYDIEKRTEKPKRFSDKMYNFITDFDSKYQNIYKENMNIEKIKKFIKEEMLKEGILDFILRKIDSFHQAMKNELDQLENDVPLWQLKQAAPHLYDKFYKQYDGDKKKIQAAFKKTAEDYKIKRNLNT